MTGSLFRQGIIWLTAKPLVRTLVAERGPGRAMASRFVAGETLDDGMRAARALNARGIGAMLDHLGENVSSPAQAQAAADAYVRALRRIEAMGVPDANISVKLTQLGLDVSYDLCLENTERVLRAAGGTLVMIDMEASEYVDRTLEAFEKLRANDPNIGLCIQSYLHRSAADVDRIVRDGAIVRLAKGAYLEPPDVAIHDRAGVSRAYARLGATVLSRGGTLHIATHDPALIEGAKRFIAAREIPRQRYEFQFLYGIRRDLQDQLLGDGYPVRVYIPYGPDWYPYLTRRLAERPANIWFFVSNLMRR